MGKTYEQLLLKNQLCFPLYACGRKIVASYTPYLKPLGLTYTQYIAMMVLWEEEKVNEKLLCETLCLKSNTVTPLLQKLESKGYIKKSKDPEDERNLVITLTKAGEKLKDKALDVPKGIACEINLSKEEAATLYTILYKMLDEDRKEG